MLSRSSKGRDFVAIARNVIEKAIGEDLDGTPLEDPDAGKDPAMEAGITDHVWSLEEMCATLPTQASAAKRIDKGLVLKALGEQAS